MRRLAFFLLIFPLWVCAQNSNAHWYMGNYLGATFVNGSRQVLTPLTSKLYAPYGASSVADKNGNLLFSTNGTEVHDRNYKLMLNGAGLQGTAPLTNPFSMYSLVVPSAASVNQYYIFSVNPGSELYMSTVDMSLNNGLGAVINKGTLISSYCDHHFTAVKQYYEEGYWLITHKRGGSEYLVYRIGKNGIDMQPLVSSIGPDSYWDVPNTLNYRYGNMVSNSRGDEIIHTYGANDNPVRIAHLHFDKRCGTLGLKGFYGPYYNRQTVEEIAFAAFSANDRYLYLSCKSQWLSSTTDIYQLDMQASDPNASRKLMTSLNISPLVDLQLAPDEMIYVTSSSPDGFSNVGMVSSISNANQANAVFNLNSVDFSKGQSIIYKLVHFPAFIMDRSAPRQNGYEKPKLSVKGACLQDSAFFTVQSDFKADSFYWDFGDQQKAVQPQVKHKYATGATYMACFHWYLCGHHYSACSSIVVSEQVSVYLGRDSTLCAGDTLSLHAPAANEYLWSTGDSTASIQVSEPGQYWLQLNASSCRSSDTIKINYHAPLWTALGSEYFLCNDDEELLKLDAGEGFSSYKWTPTGDTSQWIIVDKVGAYYVIVKDFRGCKGDDDTKVKRRCAFSLFVPTAFSPNQDGLNDIFLPQSTDLMFYRLQVYNRWGELIFETTDTQEGWDGNWQGSPAPEAVYTWVITYKGYNRVAYPYRREQGTLTLLR